MRIPIHPNANAKEATRMARGLRCRLVVMVGEDGGAYLESGKKVIQKLQEKKNAQRVA